MASLIFILLQVYFLATPYFKHPGQSLISRKVYSLYFSTKTKKGIKIVSKNCTSTGTGMNNFILRQSGYINPILNASTVIRRFS